MLEVGDGGLVDEYTPDTRYKVSYTFPNKEVALKFMEFIECTGEDVANELGVFDEELKYIYNYKTYGVELAK